MKRIIGFMVFLKISFLTLCCAGGREAVADSSKGDGRPDFLFFIADDIYADMLNYRPEGAGNVLMPNLDRLVKEGLIFRNQQIPSSVCTPSRYSCLTGWYASRSHTAQNDPLCRQAGMTLVSWTAMLDPDRSTLPKRLQQAGYFTGIAGKCHFAWFNGMKPLPPDADLTDSAVQRTLEENYQIGVNGVKRFGFDGVESFYVYGQVVDHPVKALGQHNMDWIARGGLDLIDQAVASRKPFYLYVAATMPHTPYRDDLSWNADPRVTPRGLLDEPCRVLPDRAQIPERMKAAGVRVAPDRVTRSRQAMMTALDDALGALIERLEQKGRLDNTIIVFFNDNGQEGKGTVYEGGVTSPSVIWKKGGFPAGPETDALVSNIDFAPTFLDLAGVKYDSGDFDGVSLRPLLNAEVKTVRDVAYSEMGFSRAVRKGDWKYIAVRYPENAREIPWVYYSVPGDPTAGERPTFGHMAVRPNNPQNARDIFGMRETAARLYPAYWDADQLYDLANDPGEQKNLAYQPGFQSKLQEMREEMRRKVACIPGHFGEFKTENK